jgi:hypothetical protein
MKPVAYQGWGMVGLLLVSWAIFGGLWNLAFPFQARGRHIALGLLFAGIAVSFAAMRAGRKRA